MGTDGILRMAVQFWIEAEANLLKRSFDREYLLFLSIWEWEDADLPQPYIFFCSLEPRNVMRRLSLRRPTSTASARIRECVEEFEIGPAARLFEDRETIPGEVRVLLDFDLPSNPHKLLLTEHDCNSVRADKKRARSIRRALP